MQQDLTDVEAGDRRPASRSRKLPITLAQWQELAGQLLGQYFTGGVTSRTPILAADHQISHSAWVRVAVTSGIAPARAARSPSW